MLVLTNAKLVLPEELIEGTLAAENGLIASLSHGRSSLPSAVDCEGDYLIPGIIDCHTDALERFLTPRPSVRWPIRAALAAHDAQIAASGITTVFDSLALGTDIDDNARTIASIRATVALLCAEDLGLLRAEHLLHLRLEMPHPDTVAYCEEFIRLPSVRLLSLMDHTPGQGQFLDVKQLRANLRTPANEAEFERSVAVRKELRERYTESNRKALAALAAEQNLPLASHDDRTVQDVEQNAALGATISEFPVTMEAAEAAHRAGIATVMGGPNLVLGGSHNGNASALEVAKKGWLDILASDYVPLSLLHGVCLLAAQPEITLPQAVATATSQVARATRLYDRGSLAIGLRADLARVRFLDNYPYVLGLWRAGCRVL